jgi:hypothetical protein
MTVSQSGPPSVVNPAAPGAGDDTSGGDDTPSQDDQDGQDQQSSDQQASSDQQPGQDDSQPGQDDQQPGQDDSQASDSTTDLHQAPMSAALKQEYDQANNELMQQLYGPGPVAKHVLAMLAVGGPHKIHSAVSASLVVMRSIWTKLKFPPQLVLLFTRDVTAHVMSLGERVKQIQYDDQESTAILGAAYEGALRIFGVNAGQARRLHHLVGRDQLMAHAAKYNQARYAARQVRNRSGHPFQPNPQPAQAAGPQGPQGPQGAPPGNPTPAPAGQPPSAQPQGGMPPAAPPINQ